MDSWKRKIKVMTRYDLTAQTYDEQYGQEQMAKIKSILKGFEPSSHNLVLDLGCGTGLLFNHMGRTNCVIVGVDISRQMLRKAMEKAVKTNVALIQADADYLPFKSEVFDAVFAITLLQNMPDPTRTLLEINRVLKINASITITFLKKHFTMKESENLIKRAGLKVGKLKNYERLKDYVAFCIREF